MTKRRSSVRQTIAKQRAATARRKARFDAAHAEGMKRLKAGDYDGAGEVIDEERAIIDEQISAIDPTRPKRRK